MKEFASTSVQAGIMVSGVEEALKPKLSAVHPGQPAFDPRLCAKVLTFGYATGVRSSRALEQLCRHHLAYLFLTRGDTPSYRTLCQFRVKESARLEEVWIALFAVAGECGISRLGRIVVDSSKFRADAGPESVVKQSEYKDMLAELERILHEAAVVDAREEVEVPGQTEVGKEVRPEQMRDIVRRVRRQRKQQEKASAAGGSSAQEKEPGVGSFPPGPRMKKPLEKAVTALKDAQAEGTKHVCLTDPDARMMGEGREKRIRECHNFEIAVDNGLLVVGQSTQTGNDNGRLEPLVEAANDQEPDGITAVDADSGYYAGDAVARLTANGLDVCVPDSNTACDLHRGDPVGTSRSRMMGKIPLEYDAASDRYNGPEGDVLTFFGRRQEGSQTVRVYRAERSCGCCPLVSLCMKQKDGKHRTLRIPLEAELLEVERQRFAAPEHVARYHRRGDAVETVFGFLRGALGFSRWQVRGEKRVAAKSVLFKLAYQIRKVHTAWKGHNGRVTVATPA